MRQHKFLIMIMIIASVLLIGCRADRTDKADNNHGVEEKELVFTTADWLEGIDFCQAEWWPDMASLTSDPLFIRESDGKLSPSMATDYSVSEDGLKITITLAEDLKYHDGTPVAPNDVKRSIEWALEKSIYASDFSMINEITVKDNDIILALSSYSPSILFYMGHNYWPTIKASDIDTMTADELRWKATSYGPYYVEEYVTGSHVTLRRNEYYKTYNNHVNNKGVEPVKTITVRFTTDAFAIVQGMLSNEIDYSCDITESNIKELEENTAIQCEWTPTTAVFRLMLNPQDKLFSDERVRKALSLLLDREKMAEYSDGAYNAAYAFSVKGMLDYDAGADQYYKEKYCNDPEQGLKLLRESGWEDTDGDGILDKDGEKLIIKVMYCDDAQKKIFELMQVLLKEYKIQVDGEMADGGTYIEAVKAGGDYQAALNIFAWGDTSTTLPYIVQDTSILDFERYIEKCQETAAIQEDAQRKQAFSEIQKELFDTTCIIPVVNVNSLRSYNTNRLNNLYFDENGFIYLNDVSQ